MRHRGQKGFTLFELVMVIVLMGIISVVIGKFLFQAYKTFLTSNDISEAEWQGFVALERMANDVHTIRSAGDITTVQASNFVFTDVSGNSVQYQLSGNSLMRNSQILATGIQALTFSYLSQAGTTTSTPSAVRYISMTVSETQGTISTSFSTIAATRVLP